MAAKKTKVAAPMTTGKNTTPKTAAKSAKPKATKPKNPKTAKSKTAARKSAVAKAGTPDGADATANISQRIKELSDWRGETLAQVRQLIHEADPDIVEEWKWMGTPVWSHDGGVCTGETYKQVVKLTFFRGAALDDPKKLFNSSMEGNTRRAIDLREGEAINTTAFKKLVREAVDANTDARAQGAKKK